MNSSQLEAQKGEWGRARGISAALSSLLHIQDRLCSVLVRTLVAGDGTAA